MSLVSLFQKLLESWMVMERGCKGIVSDVGGVEEPAFNGNFQMFEGRVLPVQKGAEVNQSIVTFPVDNVSTLQLLHDVSDTSPPFSTTPGGGSTTPETVPEPAKRTMP